jgi:predicted ArsR family transcriptional regulator
MAIWGEVSFKVKRAITFMERFTIGQLADMTGLEYQSVETVVQRLLKDGYITQAEPRQPKRRKRVGRPRQTYALVDDPEIANKLYASIEAFQIEEALIAAPERKPSSAHFNAAISIIDSLEAEEEEISAASLHEAAEHLDFARRYEEMIEEGVEIAHAYVDLQQARLEFLRGNEDETRRLLAQARSVFQENGIDGQAKLIDDYEIAIALRRQVSLALENAAENRFGLALRHLHDALDTLPSLSLSPMLTKVINNLVQITDLATKAGVNLASENRRLQQTNEELLAENAKLKLLHQGAEWLTDRLLKSYPPPVPTIPKRGFSLPVLKESADDLILRDAISDVLIARSREEYKTRYLA